MKAKRVVCVVKGHQWVVGRVAERWARELVDRKSYHNRACSRCEKQEWNADDVEGEADRILQVKQMLGGTQEQGGFAPVDREIDPNEFP